MIVLLILIAATTSGATALALIRRAGSLGLIQQANDRSSHVAPTATGGGLGIALGTILGVLFVGAATGPHASGIIVLAAIMAVVGLVDDRWPLSARLRLLAQLVLIGILTMALSPWQLADGAAYLLATAVLLVAGVWWVNLYNFMDGIDGFAGSQAVFMLAAALLLASLEGVQPWAQPPGLLAISAIVATLAFLGFNWPPAKIFMGDVGSTFLGFLILALAIVTSKLGWLDLWQWSILGAMFAADATVTLLWRLRSGRNIFQAHRSHAYQRMSRRLGNHLPVTLGLVVANVAIVLPVAWLAGQWPDHAWALTCGIYVAAAAAAVLQGAGRPEEGSVTGSTA